MNCPKCKGEKTQVIDSREVDNRSIRRRRECEICNFRFTTYERVEQVKLSVVKRDGRIVPFDREKVIHGMKTAANGRISDEKLSDVVDDVEQKLIETSDSSIGTKKIGQIVALKLKKLDEIAYLRFISVYKNFDNISSFEQELEKLRK